MDDTVLDLGLWEGGMDRRVKSRQMASQKTLCKRKTTKSRILHKYAHTSGLFPLLTGLPEGWNGMRAACGVNAVLPFREF